MVAGKMMHVLSWSGFISFGSIRANQKPHSKYDLHSNWNFYVFVAIRKEGYFIGTGVLGAVWSLWVFFIGLSTLHVPRPEILLEQCLLVHAHTLYLFIRPSKGIKEGVDQLLALQFWPCDSGWHEHRGRRGVMNSQRDHTSQQTPVNIM